MQKTQSELSGSVSQVSVVCKIPIFALQLSVSTLILNLVTS